MSFSRSGSAESMKTSRSVSEERITDLEETIADNFDIYEILNRKQMSNDNWEYNQNTSGANTSAWNDGHTNAVVPWPTWHSTSWKTDCAFGDEFEDDEYDFHMVLLIVGPLMCYWMPKQMRNSAAHGYNVVELDDGDSPQPSGRGSMSNRSGKRSSRDWRDDDTTGAARKKTAVIESIQKSMDAWRQLTEARLKQLVDDKEKVDVDQLNEAVFSFKEEVGIEACITVMDLLMARREMAYVWLKWKRATQLFWIQKYASG